VTTSPKELTMRLIPTAVAATAALALLAPAAAEAKEVSKARACDADGCRTITDRSTLRGMEGGQPAEAPAEGAPFYRVRMTVDIEGEEKFAYTLVYVPSEGLLRFRGEFGGYDWLAATPEGLTGFKRLTKGLEPLPGRKLRGAGAEAPQAQVDEVVVAPAGGAGGGGDDGGGLPWTLLLIPGGAALAAVVARRALMPRRAQPAAPGALAPDDLS